jgi:hypothetical protein
VLEGLVVVEGGAELGGAEGFEVVREVEDGVEVAVVIPGTELLLSSFTLSEKRQNQNGKSILDSSSLDNFVSYSPRGR